MPKPINFSGFSQMVQTIADVQNRIVKEEFSDVSDDDLDDINKPRSVLRAACTIDPNGKSLNWQSSVRVICD
jgi:hypothetical protein